MPLLYAVSIVNASLYTNIGKLLGTGVFVAIANATTPHNPGNCEKSFFWNLWIIPSISIGWKLLSEYQTGTDVLH